MILLYTNINSGHRSSGTKGTNKFDNEDWELLPNDQDHRYVAETTNLILKPKKHYKTFYDFVNNASMADLKLFLNTLSNILRKLPGGAQVTIYHNIPFQVNIVSNDKLSSTPHSKEHYNGEPFRKNLDNPHEAPNIHSSKYSLVFPKVRRAHTKPTHFLLIPKGLYAHIMAFAERASDEEISDFFQVLKTYIKRNDYLYLQTNIGCYQGVYHFHLHFVSDKPPESY